MGDPLYRSLDGFCSGKSQSKMDDDLVRGTVMT
jgi:hypothetical protein